MPATIQKWGNSHAVRLPKPLLESVSLKEHDPIVLVVSGQDIIIRKRPEAHAHRTLRDRLEAGGPPRDFALADGEYDASAVGAEVFW